MAAFTTIAAATVAIGTKVTQGVLAGDAASTAARQAGRFELEKKKLQDESIAKLEQNFLDEVRVATDIYDRKLQQDNVMGATILEAAQEGDQRGVAASAGKVKAASDMQTDKTAEKFADQKLKIDLARGAADEKSAEEIASLMDDRAAAAGVKADALTQQANDLEGQSTGAFLSAGVSALNAGLTAFGGMAGGENAMGKAADALIEKSGGSLSMSDALKSVEGMSRNDLRDIKKTGILPSTDTGQSESDVLNVGTTAPDTRDIGTLFSEYLKTDEGKKILNQNQKKNAFGYIEDALSGIS